VLLTVLLAAAPFGAAEAHTSERGYILLLPTGLYIVGGTLVVALSFVVMALLPRAGLRALESARLRLTSWPDWQGLGASLAVFILLVILLAAGFAGSRDPLENPLPLMVWSLWWVGVTFLHALFGNLWAVFNPWRAPYHLLARLAGLHDWRAEPPLAYPRWLGTAPAIALFFAFAWFELIHPSPQDPERLAAASLVYLSLMLAGMLVFGEAAWLRHGDAFSVFFRLVSWLSPFDADPEKKSLSLTLPGQRLLGVGLLPLSGAAFILLALASVSFDGLSRTFWWIDLIGENPLEHPGRTAVLGANTLGLLATTLAWIAAYTLAVLLGRGLAHPTTSTRESLGRYVVSIVPIAFGYHFAHYLPSFLVDVQYAVRALSDPFALGWNLLGTRDLQVTTSFLTDHRSVELIWYLQIAGIVLAHVMAVIVAHLLALREAPDLRAALKSQLPMTALMIGYTLFGLWLLSTPVAG